MIQKTSIPEIKLIFISANNNVLCIIGTDKDPSLRIECFAIIDLRGVSTKLYFKNSVNTNQSGVRNKCIDIQF